MNDSNDNLFSRWSRRKLAARPDDAHALPEVNEAPGEKAASHVVADSQPPRPDPVQPEAEAEAGPAEPLPRLEDLTAESDLTAFLKKGVPSALRNAALRKIWSLDPAIRDYVGPSEYAWDFNQPGSMAGFGPLDAKETVVGFLSRTARAIEPDAEPTVTPQPPDAASERSESTPSDTATNTAIDTEVPEPFPVAEPLEGRLPEEGADTAYGISSEAESAARQNLPDTDEPSLTPDPPSRPRHGGAMPR